MNDCPGYQCDFGAAASGPPNPVTEWINAQALETLHLSAISVAEARFGLASLPAGKRRDRLQANLEKQVLPLFVGRVLAFDMSASQAYSELMAKARAAGLAIGTADGYRSDSRCQWHDGRHARH